MCNYKLVLSQLVLHLRLVFFQVCQSLLQMNVLLSLSCHCLIKELGVVLHNGHYSFKVVIIQRFEISLHGSYLRSIGLDEFFVLFQFELGNSKFFL